MAINYVCVEGNLTRDPELRFTQTGKAVANDAVAFTARVNQGGEWVDGDTSFFDFTCFGSLAENVAESLAQGDRVIVAGRLVQDRWEDKDTGKNRSRVKIIASSVAPALTWATCDVTRTHSSQSKVDDVKPGPNEEPF